MYDLILFRGFDSTPHHKKGIYFYIIINRKKKFPNRTLGSDRRLQDEFPSLSRNDYNIFLKSLISIVSKSVQILYPVYTYT